MLPFNKRVKVLILLGAALVVNGQQKPAGSGAAEDAGAIFRADTRLVVCHATVVDKNGHLVTDLKQPAFTVTKTKFSRRSGYSSARTCRCRSA